LLAAGPIALIASCADDGALPGKASTQGSSSGDFDGGIGGCTDGETEECHITVGNNGGVLTCLDGVRTCVDDAWSACEGKLTSRPAPTSEGDRAGQGSDEYAKPLSLSDPVPCTSNPCDPGCMGFDEIPDAGFTAEAGVVGTFQSGDLSTIPAGYQNTGLYQPCNGNEDCQFDHVCSLPVSGTCAHSKCVTGTKLISGCDSCVDEICADDSSCCFTPTGTCIHDICRPGDALASGCDPCVTTICAAGNSPACCQDAYVAPACAHNPCSAGSALVTGCDDAALGCVTDVCATNPACCVPSFSGTCAHSPCTPGTALAGACDTCVNAVCTTNPGCCGIASTFSANCLPPVTLKGHSPCQAGKKLDIGCDPCVTAICSDPVYAYCCDDVGNAWDTACVNAVATHCAPKTCNNTWTQSCVDLVAATPGCGGKSCTPAWGQNCVDYVDDACGVICGASGWTQACVDKVATDCAITCDTWDTTCVAKVGELCGSLCEPQDDVDNGCEHDPCLVGPALDATCSACVSTICADTPACCSVGWTETCKNLVPTLCGVPCTTGDCVPWDVGALDAACPGIDLTMGVPCTDNVPVCNHGMTDAPAGVTVNVFPANTPSFPSCTPDLLALEAICTVPIPIPAGQCVTLNEASCVGLDVFSGNHTLMVNPLGLVAECHCENNWTDYHAATCDTISVSGYSPAVYSEIYTATCPAGQQVQWGFLTWNSVTPGDSSISFQAHTADTAANLGPPLVAVGTASAAAGTQFCQLAGPAPDCPVNLYDELQLPYAKLPVLELIITLNPTSQELAGPTLTDWELTYSCVDSE
jgi:hypothetical protein